MKQHLTQTAVDLRLISLSLSLSVFFLSLCSNPSFAALNPKHWCLREAKWNYRRATIGGSKQCHVERFSDSLFKSEKRSEVSTLLALTNMINVEHDH